MIEPSDVNLSRYSVLVGSTDGKDWQTISSLRKDRWSMRLFQYGNIFLPDGENSTEFVAATSIAVENGDLQASVWRTSIGLS